MYRCFLLALILCLWTGFVSATPSKIDVVVTIAPYAQFVQAVGRQHVHVNILVPGNADPELYEPAATTFVQISKAQLYVMTGCLPIEKTLSRHTQHVLNLSKSVKTNSDPHIWVSPKMVTPQIQAIANSLSKVDPAHRSDYQKNAKNYIQKLDKLSDNFSAQIQNKRHRTFLVVHPSFGYLASDYGLTQLALESEGKSPDPKQLQKITQHAKRHHLKFLLRQTQSSPALANAFARPLGMQVVEVNPLSADYLKSTAHLFDTLLRACD